jgi:aryl-alcohol dehydrogenase-like predicted oxidoreductase
MEKIPFGRTGHRSSRVLFGAAALGGMRQEKADALLPLLLEHGVNHIDTAAMYGDSELRVGAWMATRRDDFFLATKTHERTAEGARASIERSRQRLQSDVIDLVQLHNLVDEADWRTALGPGGALEALVEAKERGHVRFLGVTGHGTRAAAMHLASLERFPFDSVLLPYSFTMLAQPEYAADVERLLAACQARGVAVQTIKAIARRRWPEGAEPAPGAGAQRAVGERSHDASERRHSWYEPLRDEAALARAVRFVLARPGLFLNSSSDATLLPAVLAAAEAPAAAPPARELEADAARFAMAPLFVRGISDAI